MELIPVLSEKSYKLANEENKYVFLLSTKISKIAVAQAVAEKYGVKVVKVNTVVKPGKMKKNWKFGGNKGWSYANSARRTDKTKAIVTLAEGNKIDDFFNI